MYAGEVITVKIRGTDPVTGHVIDDATGTCYLFAPPKNPQANPGDRTPDYTLPATFDPGSRYYLATVNTTGWPPGIWWAQGLLTGGSAGYKAFEYESFPLDA